MRQLLQQLKRARYGMEIDEHNRGLPGARQTNGIRRSRGEFALNLELGMVHLSKLDDLLVMIEVVVHDEEPHLPAQSRVERSLCHPCSHQLIQPSLLLRRPIAPHG